MISKRNTIYKITNEYFFDDTLFVPNNCELCFEGGHISGNIVFDDTKLTGRVNLKGSHLSGKISNKIFDASWLCKIDGTTDDAKSINEIIQMGCHTIWFPKGVYRLKSEYNPSGNLPQDLCSSIRSHIGISCGDIALVGEKGCEFLTDIPMGTICIYSKPNDINNSIHNIRISNITFTVVNSGEKFYELMHTIKVIGVRGLVIENCVFNDFFGDAICLSHYGDSPSTGERTRNTNVCIKRNKIKGGESHNNRNGISVINGLNVEIYKNEIINTSKETMPGGIDIEPNNSAYTVENITIRDNYFEGIRGFVGAIGVVLLRDEAPAKKIKIIGNRIYNCRSGITIGIYTQSSTENLIIKNNYVDLNTIPFKFVGGGKSRDWTIKGNKFIRPTKANIPGDIQVENLKIGRNILLNL